MTRLSIESSDGRVYRRRDKLFLLVLLVVLGDAIVALFKYSRCNPLDECGALARVPRFSRPLRFYLVVHTSQFIRLNVERICLSLLGLIDVALVTRWCSSRSLGDRRLGRVDDGVTADFEEPTNSFAPRCSRPRTTTSSGSRTPSRPPRHGRRSSWSSHVRRLPVAMFLSSVYTSFIGTAMHVLGEKNELNVAGSLLHLPLGKGVAADGVDWTTLAAAVAALSVPPPRVEQTSARSRCAEIVEAWHGGDELARARRLPRAARRRQAAVERSRPRGRAPTTSRRAAAASRRAAGEPARRRPARRETATSAPRAGAATRAAAVHRGGAARAAGRRRAARSQRERLRHGPWPRSRRRRARAAQRRAVTYYRTRRDPRGRRSESPARTSTRGTGVRGGRVARRCGARLSPKWYGVRRAAQPDPPPGRPAVPRRPRRPRERPRRACACGSRRRRARAARSLTSAAAPPAPLHRLVPRLGDPPAPAARARGEGDVAEISARTAATAA